MPINIFGVVGEDVRASDILAKLQAEKGDSIEVNIMSPGGSVIEGMAIYDALRNSGKKIITRALGQAASIASIIFMAGDEREVGDNAEIMIHNAMVFAGGNKHELSSFIDRLDGIDTKLINIYATRTNLNEDQVRALLDNETFMDADEAVEKGFATCKADALAMVAQYNSTNQEKEPVLMAEDKTKAGFFAHMKAYFTNEEEEEVKAEGDNVPEEEVDSAKAEDEDMPEKEVPEAMEEEPKPEDMEALKAELEETKKELAEAKAEAESKPKAVKEEAEAKAGLVFDAMTDNKITMHEAKNLVAKNISDVEATLKEKEANATGRGKAETPKDEPKLSIYDQYQNISDAGERSTFFKAHKTEIINQSKES
jgi:ATP-dependent Clp endopeptidase proteolytic subunit ClpP